MILTFFHTLYPAHHRAAVEGDRSSADFKLFPTDQMSPTSRSVFSQVGWPIVSVLPGGLPGTRGQWWIGRCLITSRPPATCCPAPTLNGHPCPLSHYIVWVECSAMSWGVHNSRITTPLLLFFSDTHHRKVRGGTRVRDGYVDYYGAVHACPGVSTQKKP